MIPSSFKSSLNSTLFTSYAICCHNINMEPAQRYISNMELCQVICLTPPSLISSNSQDAFRHYCPAHTLGLCRSLCSAAIEAITARGLRSG